MTYKEVNAYSSINIFFLSILFFLLIGPPVGWIAIQVGAFLGDDSSYRKKDLFLTGLVFSYMAGGYSALIAGVLFAPLCSLIFKAINSSVFRLIVGTLAGFLAGYIGSLIGVSLFVGFKSAASGFAWHLLGAIAGGVCGFLFSLIYQTITRKNAKALATERER